MLNDYLFVTLRSVKRSSVKRCDFQSTNKIRLYLLRDNL